MLRSTLLGSVVLVSASIANATMISIPAEKDAMIFGTSAGADTNMASGKGPGMFAGADGSLNRKRSLIQFDIAGNVPAGAHINSANLTLFLGQVAGSGGGGIGSNIPSRSIGLFDLLQDWGEGTSGSPTNPSLGGSGQGYPRVSGDSSWDYALFDSSNPTTGKWNAGGPDLHGGNFAATASATSTFTAPFTINGAYSWSSAGMATDAQSWLDLPASNHGWLIKALNGLDSSNNPVSLEDTATTFLGFWTKDGAAANNNPAIAPALTIDFTVPEPAGLAALLAVIPLVVRRQR